MVSCVMPTADRPHFVKLAIECFRLQTWPKKELIIYDSGMRPLDLDPIPGVKVFRGPDASLGELRNSAIDRAQGRLIAHWDDDDWSHPKRIEEQVELISVYDCDIVGYRSMVFHDTGRDRFLLYEGRVDYALGSSLFFKRATWEKRRFPALQEAEDNAFIERRHLVSAYGHKPVRMVARQHTSNTSVRDLPLNGHAIRTNWRHITNSGDVDGLHRLLKSTSVW